MSKKQTPIVLCAGLHGRALLFGFVNSDPVPGEAIELHGARMCLRYPSGGTLGLAVDGPPEGSRVTKTVIRTTETVWQEWMECTPKAAEQWVNIEAQA